MPVAYRWLALLCSLVVCFLGGVQGLAGSHLGQVSEKQVQANLAVFEPTCVFMDHLEQPLIFWVFEVSAYLVRFEHPQ